MLRGLWAKHGMTVLRIAVLIMTAIALVLLPYEFWRLVWDQGKTGAIDLASRYREVHMWFAGQSVYNQTIRGTYPPASYVILWPFLDWLPYPLARVLWAATSAAALAWLVYLAVRESGASTRLESFLVGLIPMSMYATSFAIGGGRLVVHQLAPLTVGVLLLCREQARWRDDLLAALLILFALVKPSVAAPFFWIVLFVPGRLRPAILVAGGYAVLTLVAASFQGGEVISLLRDWTTVGTQAAEWASVFMDKASVHTLLFSLGLQHLDSLASLLVLTGLGIWIYLHRRVDIWLLLGVTALVARFWTYHAPYDDLLILLPMIALFRITVQSPETDAGAMVAGVLLACTMASTLAPGGRYLLPEPWNRAYVIGQVCVWLVVLGFLLYRARRLSTWSTASFPTNVPKILE